SNSRIIHHCIVSIGDYGKEESADIIIPYFKHERQEIVRAAVEAAGKLKNEKLIKHLKDVYNQEMDFIDRIAVVESLCRMKNRIKAKEALNGLLVNETMPFVKNFLVKNKNKLE
ncbi:HEAT repeat domain-containing protein, partial [candidate division KSB1 bacterium]